VPPPLQRPVRAERLLLAVAGPITSRDAVASANAAARKDKDFIYVSSNLQVSIAYCIRERSYFAFFWFLMLITFDKELLDVINTLF
jgi:hypothetical protein